MASSNLNTFDKDVTAAATAEVLISTREEVRSAVITAKAANTGTIGIRDAVGGVDGLFLSAGQSFEINAETYDTFDLNAIWLKASVDGEGVIVLWEA